MLYTIKHRVSGAVLFSLGCGSFKLCVEAAVKSGADLRDADLRGACLRGADLGGAYLGGAYLRGKKLISERPVLQVGPIGSRQDYLLSFITDGGVILRAGCFEGSRDEFAAAVEKTHGASAHGDEYRAALVLIDAHAKAWTPAVEPVAEAA